MLSGIQASRPWKFKGTPLLKREFEWYLTDNEIHDVEWCFLTLKPYKTVRVITNTNTTPLLELLLLLVGFNEKRFKSFPTDTKMPRKRGFQVLSQRSSVLHQAFSKEIRGLMCWECMVCFGACWWPFPQWLRKKHTAFMHLLFIHVYPSLSMFIHVQQLRLLGDVFIGLWATRLRQIPLGNSGFLGKHWNFQDTLVYAESLMNNGLSPFPVIVTTRIFTLLVDISIPINLQLPLLDTGKGCQPKEYFNVYPQIFNFYISFYYLLELAPQCFIQKWGMIGYSDIMYYP